MAAALKGKQREAVVLDLFRKAAHAPVKGRAALLNRHCKDAEIKQGIESGEGIYASRYQGLEHLQRPEFSEKQLDTMPHLS